MGVQPEVQSLIVKSYRITELHYNYGNATLSADYVGYLYFHNQWVTPRGGVTTHMGVNSKGSLCWLAQPRKSLGYTTLMGV